MNYVYNQVPATRASAVKEIETFLKQNDLKLDKGITDFIEVRLDGDIVACGGVDHNIIKCVAIAESLRGEGVSLRLMTELLNIANDKGFFDIFLFTKPENRELFSSCGFYYIEQFQDKILLMENSPVRLKKYCEDLSKSIKPGKKIGSMVINANPFTLGHKYLIETAAAQCDWLHVFLVKEDLSMFPYKDRFMLVQKGIQGIDKVTLYPGSDYIISRASFPNYFLKEEKDAEAGYTALDLMIFREYIAPALKITHRFVGTEPIDMVTNQYNQDMRRYLFEESSSAPAIEVIEIPRKTTGDQVISASKVRAYLRDKNFEAIKEIVPSTTYEYLLDFNIPEGK